MLPSTITLAVDEDNTGSGTTDHAYDRHDYFANRSVYIHGTNHSAISRDMINFYRTAPKQNGNFRGVMKRAVKFTQDQVVDGVDGVSQIVSPIIYEISCSIPVGVSLAAQVLMRQKGVALLDMDTIMDALWNQGAV